MPTPETLFTFFVSAVILAFAPGPDIIFVLTQSALFGSRAGLLATLGFATGIFWHTAVVACGIAALIAASPVAFTVLKCIGAAYLLYLAWLTAKSGMAKADLDGKNAYPGHWAIFRRGVIMNMTNPKVTLFALALLPQFADPSRGAIWSQIVILGMVFQFATIVAFGITSCLGGALAQWLNRSPKGQKAINFAAAAILAGLGVALVFF